MRGWNATADIGQRVTVDLRQGQSIGGEDVAGFVADAELDGVVHLLIALSPSICALMVWSSVSRA